MLSAHYQMAKLGWKVLKFTFGHPIGGLTLTIAAVSIK
jgi:hypothetical protein